MVVQLEGSEEASTCTICFEPVNSNEEVFALSCGHRHHLQCLTGWLERKNECPDCRGRVAGTGVTPVGPIRQPVASPVAVAEPAAGSTREQLVAMQALQVDLAATGRWTDPALQTTHQDDDGAAATAVGPAENRGAGPVIVTSNPISAGSSAQPYSPPALARGVEAREAVGIAVMDDPDQEGDEL